jgi:hypothetical protein
VLVLVLPLVVGFVADWKTSIIRQSIDTTRSYFDVSMNIFSGCELVVSVNVSVFPCTQ